MLAWMAERARGLFFQQLEPVRAEALRLEGKNFQQKPAIRPPWLLRRPARTQAMLDKVFLNRISDSQNSTAPIPASHRKGFHTVSMPAPRYRIA